MNRIGPILFLVFALLLAGLPPRADATALSQVPLEGRWIGRFFGVDEDTSQAASSAFCGVHRSDFQEVVFEFGRLDAKLKDSQGFQLELAGAFVGRNFIGDVRLTDGKGLELLGPAKGVLSGTGEARISFKARDIGGRSDRICSAVFRLKKGTGGN